MGPARHEQPVSKRSSRVYDAHGQKNVGFFLLSANDEQIVSRFGLAVRRKAGKRKDLGSIPLRLSFLFKKVVVCGHCLVTLSITFC